MNRGGILQRMRTGGLLLALFALTFKAMLPPGFMLDAGGGRVAITLCSGAEMYLDRATGEISHDGDTAPADDSSQHCPFAFATASALAPPVLLPEPPRPALHTGAAPVRRVIGQHAPTGPPLPARGPPLSA